MYEINNQSCIPQEAIIQWMGWLCLEAFAHSQTTETDRELGPAAQTAPCEQRHAPLRRSAGSRTPLPSRQPSTEKQQMFCNSQQNLH